MAPAMKTNHASHEAMADLYDPIGRQIIEKSILRESVVDLLQ
jgi:hypothetical protein